MRQHWGWRSKRPGDSNVLWGWEFALRIGGNRSVCFFAASGSRCVRKVFLTGGMLWLGLGFADALVFISRQVNIGLGAELHLVPIIILKLAIGMTALSGRYFENSRLQGG
jgi:hypothetical protein